MNSIIFYLEIALKAPQKKYIYGFENISHIPTSKLIEIFGINLNKDPQITNSYFLYKTKYKKFKKYLDAQIGISLDFDIFEYTLLQYSNKDELWLRKLYKLDLFE